MMKIKTQDFLRNTFILFCPSFKGRKMPVRISQFKCTQMEKKYEKKQHSFFCFTRTTWSRKVKLDFALEYEIL